MSFSRGTLPTLSRMTGNFPPKPASTVVGRPSDSHCVSAEPTRPDIPVFPAAAISRLRMGTDGEGLTTLVCAWGCPLRCAYCINKFTWDDKTKIDRLTPQELYDKVKLDSLYFEATGGGITFGGGESLMYADFFPEFRALCGTRWKLYAETSLCVPEKNVLTAIQTMDGFIVDIKDTNPAIYRSYTGHDISPAIDNLRLLASLVDPGKIRVRLPLIRDYNAGGDRDRSEALLREMGIRDIDRFTYIIR